MSSLLQLDLWLDGPIGPAYLRLHSVDKVSMDDHDTSPCPAFFGLTPATRDSKERNHEYGLLGACLYMMMRV